MPCTARKHGFSTEQFPVSAYVGSSKNLKNLKGSGVPLGTYKTVTARLRSVVERMWRMQDSQDQILAFCRANVAHARQTRPDSGPGFQAKVLTPIQVVPSSLGSGG